MRNAYRVLCWALLLAMVFGGSAFADATKQLPEDAVPLEEQVIRKPWQFTDGRYLDFMKTMYNRIGSPEYIQEPLVKFDKDFELHPGAAIDWELHDDGLTWTFYLNPEMRWSDGEPLTAEDYVFALERAVTEGYDFSWYYSWAADIKNWTAVESGELPVSELGVEAIDDHTIQVTTGSPRPYLPSVLVWWYAIPVHVIAEHGDTYATSAENLVASGPFMVTEWIRGQRIVYEPNPYYAGTWKPYPITIIEVAGTGHAEVGFPAYIAEELDFSNVNPGQLRYVMDRIPDELYSWPSYQVIYMSMNTDVEPFDNLKLRQAISMAIDRELLTNTVLQALAEPATTLLMPGYPGYNPDLEDIQAFNPERARELLAEAGYPNGEGLPSIELMVRNEDGLMHIQNPLAQFVQDQLKTNLGIDMGIRIVEMRAWSDALANRSHNLFMSPYAKDYFDPSNFVGLFTASGREMWYNEEYDHLVSEANAIVDWDERQELYSKAEAIMLEEAPATMLISTVINMLWKPFLAGEGVEPNAVGIVSADGMFAQYFHSHLYVTDEK